MHYKTTNPSWGREVTEYLDNMLTSLKVNYKEKTSQQEKAWQLLAYYTRDLRLANINMLETVYCQTWLNIAGDCLRLGYGKSFVTALSRVITVTELSQSKGGFLRRRLGTFTQEKITKDEPGSKNLLGGKKAEA
jgi:hypothetical protein